MNHGSVYNEYTQFFRILIRSRKKITGPVSDILRFATLLFAVLRLNVRGLKQKYVNSMNVFHIHLSGKFIYIRSQRSAILKFRTNGIGGKTWRSCSERRWSRVP